MALIANLVAAVEGRAAVLTAMDEDERIARAAITSGGTAGAGDWRVAEDSLSYWLVVDADQSAVVYDEGVPTVEEARHIARNSPDRVLRRVAAERRLLEEHALCLTPGDRYGWCAGCEEASGRGVYADACPVLAALADAYGLCTWTVC